MAVFLIGCSVIIGSFKFNQVNEIKVKSSWKNIEDTATIKLPLLKGKVTKERQNESLADKINAGDLVDIKMRYKGLHGTYEYHEFKGFVKSVSPNIPLEIECEDAVYLLKKINLEKSWRSTTLKEVVDYIVTETNKDNEYKIKLSGNIPDIKFEKFRLDNVNGAEALQKIKEEYGLVASFQDMTLFVGLAYTNIVGSVRYHLAGKKANVSLSNLTYSKAEDKKIRLKAISILKDNTQISVEVGDKRGEVRTQFYYKIQDEKTLEKLASADIEKLRFEGYEGDLHTLLIPFVQHSMTAELIDPEFKNRDGLYMVDEVETTFGSGIQRVVKLGKRL